MAWLVDHAMQPRYARHMICRVCEVEQSDSAYSDWGRRRRECRSCVSARNREYGQTNKAERNERLRSWRRRNPEAARAKDQRARLARKYQLTPEEVTAMVDAQGGRCLLCGSDRRVLVVDHCHVSGRVRGMLCRSCNTIVGQVELTPGLLDAIGAYLDHGNTTSGLASSNSTSA